jgi:hypothetical protein
MERTAMGRCSSGCSNDIGAAILKFKRGLDGASGQGVASTFQDRRSRKAYINAIAAQRLVLSTVFPLARKMYYNLSRV